MGDVVLISTYELGRQPFGLASPAAWLADAGADVVVEDLAVADFDPAPVRNARLVGIYVPMHTATRMAESVLVRVRELNAHAHVCAYGLYAPMNAGHLRRLGADTIIGGEFEQPLVDLYREVVGTPRHGAPRVAGRSVVSLERQRFRVPDRSGLPDLERYAALQLAPGRRRTVGYTEATRGCKHVCRHCPIVPVYGGRFRVVQADTVIEDVRQQVAAGAQHITFGDPDFLNAPRHAERVVTRLHDEFPALTYDVTIKVEHLRRHPELVAVLERTGCVLVTTAVESVDEVVLERLDKRHTAEDLAAVLAQLREAGLALNPTFVAFTPWTTLRGYTEFLAAVVRLGLVDAVAPVQYSIRLLIPEGSRLLELDDVRALLGDFDPGSLAYPWHHPDPRVDLLHAEVTDVVKAAQRAGAGRRDIFTAVWRTAFGALGEGPTVPDLSRHPDAETVPQLTELWYCCAEPTDEQLAHL